MPLAISALGDVAFQHLTLVVHSPPKVVSLAVNLYKILVQMPLPVQKGPHSVDPASPDFRCKHRTKTGPPKPDSFMADFDTTFMQQILDIPE